MHNPALGGYYEGKRHWLGEATTSMGERASVRMMKVDMVGLLVAVSGSAWIFIVT